MKIVFLGTSDFAAAPLNALLLSKHKILGVVTAADKRKGRGQRLGFSPIKILAQRNKLTTFQSENLRDDKFLQSLRKLKADLFVVCAYGKILTKELLQIPQKFAINLHASLLPKYRGAAPINWAIIKGESQTGVTIFKMNECMDRGEIILQEKEGITFEDTALSLGQKLATRGARLLVKAVDLIEQEKCTFTCQDEVYASYAPKLKKADGLINWQDTAFEIYNRIKGLVPWPGAFTYLGNRLLKIWEGKIVESVKAKEPGEILCVDNQKGILVQAGKDQLLITVLQLEGRKKMPAGEFIAGHNIEIGKRLGK